MFQDALGQQSGCFGAIAVAVGCGAVGEAEVRRASGVRGAAAVVAAARAVSAVRDNGGGEEEVECIDAVE